MKTIELHAMLLTFGPHQFVHVVCVCAIEIHLIRIRAAGKRILSVYCKTIDDSVVLSGEVHEKLLERPKKRKKSNPSIDLMSENKKKGHNHETKCDQRTKSNETRRNIMW